MISEECVERLTKCTKKLIAHARNMEISVGEFVKKYGNELEEIIVEDLKAHNKEVLIEKGAIYKLILHFVYACFSAEQNAIIRNIVNADLPYERFVALKKNAEKKLTNTEDVDCKMFLGNLLEALNKRLSSFAHDAASA